MIPNITFLVAAFVITMMAKLLTDKDTNSIVALLAIITIAVALLVSFSTFMEGVRVSDALSNRAFK